MSRVITIPIEDVIRKIELNLEAHQEDYAEAVVAYKKEAEKQLKAQLKAVRAGSTQARLNLTEPIDSTREYEKLLEQFEMEAKVADVVKLDQHEYNKIIHDETDFARAAMFSNSFYKG